MKKFLTNNFILLFTLYYCTLFIDTTSLVVDYPILEFVSKIARYIVYFLFFVRLILILPEYKKEIIEVKWKSKTLIIKLVYILLALMIFSLIVNFIITKNKRMLFVIFVLFTSYKTDYKKIINTTMKLQIILTSIVVLLSILGITQNYAVPRKDIARYSLGFLYTTNLAQMVLFSAILYMYNVRTKIKIRDLFVIQLLNSFTYFITNSRAEFIMLELAIVVMMIWKALKKLNKNKIIEKIKRIYSCFFSRTFIIYPVLSYIVVMFYPLGGIWSKLNIILSNRLKQTYDNIVLYGIKPFGEKIEFLGYGLKDRLKYGSYKSNYIDNEYIQIMFNHGYIFTICFVIMMALLLIMLYRNKKYNEIILCSIYLLFGLINPRIISFLYSPILFMLIPTIIEYSKNNIKRKSEEQIN